MRLLIFSSSIKGLICRKPLLFQSVSCYSPSLHGLYAHTTSLLSTQNRIEEAWSSIDVALKRRCNLIQNLVSVIKRYEKHEGDTLNRKMSYGSSKNGVGNRIENESHIPNSLSGLLAIAEAYPDLKASVNLLELQKSLAEIEENIQAARVRYNNIVARLNTLVESFPASLIAAKFGFRKRNYFSLDLVTQLELPQVEFGQKSEF